MRPFLLAALNIDPSAASPALARAVVRETIATGGRACRPYLAPKGLSAAFVEPAIAFLQRHGGDGAFRPPAAPACHRDDRVTRPRFRRRHRGARARRRASCWRCRPMRRPPSCPGCRRRTSTAPSSTPISASCRRRGLAPMIGVLNGVAEWIFAFEDRISVTISGADRLLQHCARRDRQDDLARCDSASPTSRPSLPPWQIVRERRATFAATPAQNARAPGRRTAWRNLILAGDWTATGLPATIESAVRSGNRAADLVCSAEGLRSDMQREPDVQTTALRSPWRSARRAPALDRAIAAATQALLALPAERRPLGVRTRSRRDDPGRIYPAQALSRRAGRRRRWSRNSPSICAGSKARMAAGRCSTTATST